MESCLAELLGELEVSVSEQDLVKAAHLCLLGRAMVEVVDRDWEVLAGEVGVGRGRALMVSGWIGTRMVAGWVGARWG